MNPIPISPFWKSFFFLLFFVGIALLSFPDAVWANDLLKDSQKSLQDTVMGTGKLFIYLIEAVIAIAFYMKTRNLMVFIGVIVIAVFIEIVTRKFLGA